MKNLRAGLIVFISLTVLTGAVYPLLVYALGQGLFPGQANGSLLRKEGRVIGSSLIGQDFKSPEYFWPRPSAGDYTTMPGSASNLGPTSADLRKRIEDRQKLLAPFFTGAVPPELLLASASGLDPHISPDAARAQVNHVAQARGLAEPERKALAALVEKSIEPATAGFMGQPRVNVLRLNLALDNLDGSPRPGGKP